MNLTRQHPDALADSLPPLVLDRQRIVHSAAFRRLQYKTQVFVALEEDHFRTRLTHTLEVANLARILAARLGLDPDLAEVVALAHDLGHPPFGHAGERALDECTRDHGGFEHNAHSLRVVEFLEHPYPAFRGLNLTHVVRECLAKHSTRYDKPGGHPLQDGLPAPLEGEIADMADRLAYTLHDLQDGIYANLIDRDALSELQLWRDAAKSHAAPDARIAAEVRDAADDSLWRRGLRSTIDRMQNALVEDFTTESRTRLAALFHSPADTQPSLTTSHVHSHSTPSRTPAESRPSARASNRQPLERVSLERVSLERVSLERESLLVPDPGGIPSANPESKIQNPKSQTPAPPDPLESARDDADASPPRRISPSPAMESRLHDIERFLLTHVYRHNRLVRMDSKARRVIRAVFDAYVAEPTLMPRRFAARVSDLGPHRVAADYIAGMTDRFCLREHARLFDPNTLSD